MSLLIAREVLEVVKDFIAAYRDRTLALRERTAVQDQTAQDLVEINRKLMEKTLNV